VRTKDAVLLYSLCYVAIHICDVCKMHVVEVSAVFNAAEALLDSRSQSLMHTSPIQ
jgi:hypothetical protein